ncbi:MAG: hypothetical protein CM1200mP2_29430 [Planctomycetaceae bacterium]|nr:MAG: hypothetical protein CM1200mP2_29430 [Planctomycetaceae bacterium]
MVENMTTGTETGWRALTHMTIHTIARSANRFMVDASCRSAMRTTKAA